ncbi:MAG: MBL fold metallo-hydrolase [Verrucomicrobia bacterium]|nr:MBL fold metallo-hydrolase [Verrucomicrobiota bacterium]
MEITDHIHAIRVPFSIPLPGGRWLERFTWIYVVLGDRVGIVDAGVAGSWARVGEFLARIGRRPDEVAVCAFTHAHPDHIGSAQSMRAATGCRFAAHAADQPWIEDVELQARRRPVPGFHELVEGGVPVDDVLDDGARIDLGAGQTLRVIHTPGHSPGHIALLHEAGRVLITGDALVESGSMPTYTDAADTVRSLQRLRRFVGVDLLLSSLDDAPITRDRIAERVNAATAYVGKVHRAVRASQAAAPDLDLTRRTADVIERLGLPPFAANPITALALASHLDAADDVFAV